MVKMDYEAMLSHMYQRGKEGLKDYVKLLRAENTRLKLEIIDLKDQPRKE